MLLAYGLLEAVGWSSVGRGPKLPNEGPESYDSYFGPGGSLGPGSRWNDG